MTAPSLPTHPSTPHESANNLYLYLNLTVVDTRPPTLSFHEIVEVPDYVAFFFFFLAVVHNYYCTFQCPIATKNLRKYQRYPEIIQTADLHSLYICTTGDAVIHCQSTVAPLATSPSTWQQVQRFFIHSSVHPCGGFGSSVETLFPLRW